MRVSRDEGCESGGEASAAPANRIKATPKLGNVYWCDFWEDARRPEFHKTRPVVVISRDNRLNGLVTVIPLTTKPQIGNRWAHKLPRNPNPKPAAPGNVWAVCNHLYTVSCSRLAPMRGSVPRLTEEEFAPVLDIVLRWLPRPLGWVPGPHEAAGAPVADAAVLVAEVDGT